ncbi:MAG TPA: hypothetical protein VE090_06025 [Methylomirabilota bacterium]|nr:hypothetical protein [Methylomirabilota bacterium]
MITIVHGDNIALSRKYFLEEKQKDKDSFLLDGEKIAFTDLMQIFEGGELFSQSKNVFIEHFFARKKKKDEFATFTAYLQKQATNNTIFLWEGKELERSSLMAFKTATNRIFKLPQTLFLFLDSLKPSNGKELISLFHQTIATTDAEMVFFMLVRQVRLLLAIAAPTNEPIDEVKRLAPWQKGKLEKQAWLFDKVTLRALHHHLFHLEVAQKTGELTMSLTASIDFLLFEI